MYYLEDASEVGEKILIRTTGENIRVKEKITRYNDRKYTTEVEKEKEYKNQYVYLIVPDDEMRPRLLKAFKHLAYLATEKRKKNRAASGEKF